MSESKDAGGRKPFVLTHPKPRRVEIDGIGAVDLRPLTVSLETEVDAVLKDEDPTGLGDRLIALFVRDAADQPVEPKTIETWSGPAKRALLEEAVNWYERWLRLPEDGQNVPEYRARVESEPAERYLGRLWRAKREQRATHSRELLARLAGSAYVNPLRKYFEESGDAARALKEQTDALSARRSLIDDLIKAPPPPDFSNLRNPVHDTNQLLEEVSDHLKEVVRLAATTADLNRATTEAAGSILTIFAEGAEESRKAADRSLWFAAAGLVVAVIALITPFIQSHLEKADEAAEKAEDRRNIERLIGQVDRGNRAAADVTAAAITQSGRATLEAIELLRRQQGARAATTDQRSR